MFRINEVLRFDGKLYRVLSVLADEVVWIAIEEDSAFPTLVSISEMMDAIENGLLTRVEDPYAKLAFLSPGRETKARLKRDQNYELITPLITHPDYYLPKTRSELVNRIIAERGSTKQTLYRLARRYWQRGITANALLPDYKNSGGKGKRRIGKDVKLGRPRKYTPGVGAIIDEGIERLFRISIDKYQLTEKGHALTYTHRKFKSLYKTYFPDVSESEIPSFWQFKYFYDREYGQAEKLSKRVPPRIYNKDVRPLHATANTQVLGPGSRFEIDATIADIYLVSDSDRRNIVGRPVVYVVGDVFSRMVAGLYIGFENPSYVAALQALAMAMTDKVAYCKKYDLNINSEDWPIVGLPDAILADRGELLGHQIESLERIFSIRIENAEPYRPDYKGIVERKFRIVQTDFKPFAPGVVTSTRVKKRGGHDYRLDAKLTVTEFTKIILASVLYHNRYQPLVKYDRDSDMPTDLAMTPLSLWHWGLQHRTGSLHVVPEDALRISLMPRIKAQFSELGISAFGIYYTSQEVLKQGWLHRGKQVSRPRVMEAAYDPASADHIYLLPSPNRIEYWVCGLTQRSREFIDCSFWDIWKEKADQKRALAKSKLVADQKKREMEEFIEAQIKSALEQSPLKEKQGSGLCLS